MEDISFYTDFSLHVVAFFEASVLKKSVFYVRYLYNNITIPSIP